MTRFGTFLIGFALAALVCLVAFHIFATSDVTTIERLCDRTVRYEDGTGECIIKIEREEM